MLSRRSVVAGGFGAGAIGASVAAEALDLRGALPASEAGLVPNDPADQSRAFSRALERAAADGLALLLPPGDYRVAEIDLPPRAALLGVPGATRLVFSGGRHVLRARDAARLSLTGLVLDGDQRLLEGDAAGLLVVEGAADLAVEDCAFLASSASGLVLTGAAGCVSACRFESARSVALWSRDANGLLVHGNRVLDIGDTGILVQRSTKGEDGTIVTANHVSGVRAASGGTGQFGNAINVVEANGVAVSNNRLENCAFSAVRVFSSDDALVTGNVATRMGETALYVEFAFLGAVVSGNIVDDAALGISFANFLEHGGRLSTCSGNLIRNLRPASLIPTDEYARYGIGISAEADAAVTGNVVEGAPLIGLQLGWGPYLRDLAVTGNVVRDCGAGIVASVVEGAGAALIANNLVSGARNGALLGARWTEVVTADLAGEAGRFPHLAVQGNMVA